jgi:Fe-S-cluster-containing dehydrogenase component/formate-dependent nitrite reductase membrane component NrfD
LRYGFVIDQNRCIGCHACTVACKEEHNVPVGVFRTWVKYIEKGQFPNVGRHFGVMRCNHCDDAPCIEICPTHSLYRRADGIVDFDPDRCIGCKSCMQACPYDAIYIDPNSHTAAKCNFCAHRIEMNLEPACVIVCPTHAILAGDLDNPASTPSLAVASAAVVSPKPYKRTRPKLFYVGIDETLLNPVAPVEDTLHLWASRNPADGSRRPAATETESGQEARIVYDVAHPTPWGWKIGAYLFTKSAAAGILLVAALMIVLGADSSRLGVAVPGAALFFTSATAVLLIADLKRPERFYFLLTRPNPRSWVVIGAWILIAYGAIAALWLMWALLKEDLPPVLVWTAAALAIAAAGYSGVLFAQARGRDLWQSSLFTWHLIAQAAAAGAAILLLVGRLISFAPLSEPALRRALAISLTIGLLIGLGEFFLVPTSRDAKLAKELMLSGALRLRLLGGALGLGIAALIFLLAMTPLSAFPEALESGAAVLTLAGIWIFDALWVHAGQVVPLS